MKLEDVIENAFMVKPEEVLSQVASKMANEKKYEAFVFDKELKGVVTLDDIVKKRVSEPQKMKISYLMKPVTVFSVETPVEDIMNYMLVSEHRSLPIEKDGKIYAVTKPKLLKFIKDEIFAGKKAIDVMQKPYRASTNDTISTVATVMRDTGVNRIPVVDEEGRFAGLVDSLGLAGMLVGRERSQFGERDGEKVKLGNVGVGMFLRTDILKVSPETDLKQIVKKISNEDSCTAIVEENGKFMGMITIKDIFKLIGKSLETVYIRVSGLHDEDEFVRSKIDEMIEKTINKLLKTVKVTYVALHVDTHKKKARKDERMKYSVHGRIVTDKGNFYASDYEWEPTKAVKVFLDRIETEVHRQVERGRGY